MYLGISYHLELRMGNPGEQSVVILSSILKLGARSPSARAPLKCQMRCPRFTSLMLQPIEYL